MRMPFRRHVPKGVVANLQWRKRILQRAIDDESFIDVLRVACASDPIFWLNGFCWTYDTRRRFCRKLPFILYDYQETAITEIIEAFNNDDLLIEKSRDMGASWLCVAAATWAWLFQDFQAFLFVSRKEEYVDASGNPKTLFWKFDFLIDTMPAWLRPRGFVRASHRRSLHVENPANGSVIDGESTTGQVARGDRRTAILLDEFAAVDEVNPGTGQKVLAATRDATPCRLYNSTHQGIGTAFYERSQSRTKKLRLHWSSHPIKSAGLYTADKIGYIKHLDDVPHPDDFEPILDGKVRSPWYDKQCARAGSPQEIAQELDIDPFGSGHQFFNPDKVNEAIAQCVRPPSVIGELEYDWVTGDPIRFTERYDYGQRVNLWCLVDKDGKPLLDHKVVLGVDVSAGTGASNSCVMGYDSVTYEKVFEYVTPRIRPEGLALFTVAVARWFKSSSRKTPFLIWESNGPGRQFGAKVLELGFSSIYLRINDQSISKKVSDVPGFPPTKDSKYALLSEYRAAVENQTIINRSKRALEETLEYVFLATGGAGHASSGNKQDPSGANANHGDRVMADALAWKAIGARVTPMIKEQEIEIPIGSLAWRRRKREDEKRPANEELKEGW